MTENTIIALAQMGVQNGEVEANILKHLRMMETVSLHNSAFIVFPELSLTGYELGRARELAFELTDPRLDPLKDACRRLQLTAIVGAPIKRGTDLVLGSFILFANGTSAVYSKRYLHSGEERVFVPHDWNPLLIHKRDVISLAICADTNNPLHAKVAFENHSTLYLASVLFTPSGYAADTAMLQQYARQYRMTVMMTNYCGFTGGYEAAGGSLVIDTSGTIVAALGRGEERILIASRKQKDTWSCTECY